MINQPGTIPLSAALSEANPLSLNELMGADPEGVDFVRNPPLIVQALRAQAERFALADANGKGGKAAKAPKATDPGQTESTVEGELDF